MTAEPGWRERNRSAARRLANVIAKDHVAPGDVAALRRTRLGETGGPPMWKLAVQYLEPEGLLPDKDGPYRDEIERRWTALLAGMAEARSPGKGRPLGLAMAEAGVSEARLLRLLRARDVSLLRIVRTVVHQLASSGQAPDWADFADLILSQGSPDWEETARRKIARAYYRSTSADKAD